MKEFIDSYRTANDISMNSPYQGAYLIVEGERDYILFGKYVNLPTCELLSVNGKPNVIEVINLVNQRGNSNTLGIVDSDFQKIFAKPLSIPNLLESDYHDIEIAMFVSPNFETMLSLHCQKNKVEAFLKEKRGTIREFILELVKPLAYLKLTNDQYNLGLVFKPHAPEGDFPDYSKCYDNGSMNFLGIENMITILINYSRNKSKRVASPQDILTAYNKVTSVDYDLLQLCNGHDVIHLFQICLRRKLSNYDRKQYSLKNLEIQFILGYDSIFFSNTNLYTQIKGWEQRKKKTVLSF